MSHGRLTTTCLTGLAALALGASSTAVAGMCAGVDGVVSDSGADVVGLVNTCGQGNEWGSSSVPPYTVSCANGQNSPDLAYTFIAPWSGPYTFDTETSTFDTAIMVRDGADCGVTQLACDDDGGTAALSSTTVNLVQGQEVIVVVGGYGGTACGDAHLNITGCSSADVDTDGDLVCDTYDQCTGDDASGDADGDGTCDDLDLCFGDDTFGDSDVDGVCDDVDVCPNDPGGDDDADGVCDFVDLCFGDNATGDTDGDGVCDDLDICVGDDASGDDDGDGLCNDTDTTCDNFDGDLGSVVGVAALTGDTCGAGDDFYAACAFSGNSTAADLTYTYTAAGDGLYTFDLSLSGYDTVLSVRDPSDCGQTIDACDDDGGTGTTSLLQVPLTAGQQIVLSIDGYSANCGAFQLDITGCSTADDADADGVCDDLDLCDGDDATGDTDGDGICDDTDACLGDNATGDNDGDGICNDTDTTCDNYADFVVTGVGSQLVTGSTCGFGNDWGNSTPYTVTCASAQNGEDVSVLWTAPADGDFTINTDFSTFDTALVLRDQTDCGLTEIECDDDDGEGTRSQIQLTGVTAGDTFLFIVDRYGTGTGCGDFNFNAFGCASNDDTDGDGICDSLDLCLGDNATGDSDGDGTCDDSDACFGDNTTGDTDMDGICDDVDACPNDPGGDADGDGICDSVDLCYGDDATGDTDGDGTCDDLDACVGDDTTGDNDGDGICNDTDTTCDNYDGDLGSVTGAMVSVGNTCGAGDDSYPSCALNGISTADDLLLTWTAPSDGTYVFSLANSTYDTVMSLRDPADCGITEGACNDDTVGLQSEVTADLLAGDTVVIAIDGYNTACGDYELDITAIAACADIDADGVCDDVELCYGNDVGGDADNDGLCEPQLLATTVTPGQPLDLGLLGGPPGTEAAFLATTHGASGGTACLPAYGVCTELVRPTLVGRATVDPTGLAVLTVTVPASIPPGIFVGFQGAWLDHVLSVGETSNVVVRRVQTP
ncbi:MAG: hypothetical protein H6733_13190 [Alphaproteobacteria bacterium]|nr:hypothetical protein [Alphaproteobacteria bacterium]